MYFRCHSIREEKQRKEEEEKEAQRRAEEEERRRREEEEEEMRRMEEEEIRRKAEEEEARRKAEEEEAARKAQEAEAKAAAAAQKQKEEEEERRAKEPQTREDPDIELVAEEMLDDNLPAKTEEERGEEDGEVTASSHPEEEQGKDNEDDDDWLETEEEYAEPLSPTSDSETNGTLAGAGPQHEKEEEEDLENQTLGQSNAKPGLTTDGVASNALTTTSPGQRVDKPTTSTNSRADQKRARPAVKGQTSRSQEKREQRRRRGLEHNQRESERAASTTSSSSAISKDEKSPSKNKGQETAKLKERTDSKELDQYTFVAWKGKDDKGGKKEAKTSLPSAGPVRPSTLSLQPANSVPERNGLSEGAAGVSLQRRAGAIKEKPEKWRGRKSDGDHSENTSPPPPHNREERRKKQLYVSISLTNKSSQFWHTHTYLSIINLLSSIFLCLFICRSETASSSIDSLSPGSEGAGAFSAREVFEVLDVF